MRQNADIAVQASPCRLSTEGTLSAPAASCTIRDIDPQSEKEIALVAQRMRQTLIEVEGADVGTAMYSIDWLKDRVRWHLDAICCGGRVFLALLPDGDIAGHTIVRVEMDEAGMPSGLFSTSYVDPAWRRLAIAHNLLQHGERWMAGKSLDKAATWTSSSNDKLIGLYTKHGYAIVQQHTHEGTGTVMVKLEKSLRIPS